MPGSSLWLLPPASHPLHAALSTLISKTLPSLLPAESDAATLADVDFFPPHVTLTSEIDPAATYGDNPQGWLDAIPFPKEKVCVRFVGETVVSQDVYVRRCYLPVALDGVRAAAAIARARGVYGEPVPGPKTEAWLRAWVEAFGPHLSLM